MSEPFISGVPDGFLPKQNVSKNVRKSRTTRAKQRLAQKKKLRTVGRNKGTR